MKTTQNMKTTLTTDICNATGVALLIRGFSHTLVNSRLQYFPNLLSNSFFNPFYSGVIRCDPS